MSVNDNLGFLLMYGNDVLSNEKWNVSSGDPRSSSPVRNQYGAPAGSDGVRIVNTRVRHKNINLRGYVNKGNSTMFNTISELDRIFNEDEKLFRLCTKYYIIFQNTDPDDWTLSDDATNKSEDTLDYQLGNNSLSFDIDVSASGNNYSTLVYSPSSAFDLDSLITNDTGNLEFLLNLPDVEYITSIDFRLGNDSSNYYSASFTTDYQGEGLKFGWNLFSIPLGEAALPDNPDLSAQTYANKVSETGTVNDAAIDYLYIRINYSASAVDISGCKFGGLLWVDEFQTVNYRCKVEGANKKPFEHYNVDDVSFEVELLNPDGYGRFTHPITVINESGIDTADTIRTLFYLGNFSPKPLNIIDINVAGGLSQVSLSNMTNGQGVDFIPNTTENGDQLIFGGLELEFTQNGENIDYSGRIPDFKPGFNRQKFTFNTSNTTTAGYTPVSPSNASGPLDTDHGRATPFQLSTAGSIQSVNMKMNKDDNNGALFARIEIWDDNSGDPGQKLADIGVPQEISFNGVAVSAYPEFLFTNTDGNPPILSAGLTYYVVVFIDSNTSTAGLRLSNVAGGAGYPWTGDPHATTNGGVSWTTETRFCWLEIESTDDFNGDADWNQTYYPLFR